MYSLPTVIILASAMLSVAWIYTSKLSPEKKAAQIAQTASASEVATVSPDEEAVLPSSGIELPVTWGDLGAKLSSVGAIDAKRFEQLYAERGEYSEAYKKLLYENNPEKLRMTASNAGYLLNLFWALGLASKNPVLDSGEMQDPRYGGAGGFASTGGWTMAMGNGMDHYSRHMFFTLTKEQQALVEKVSRGIYRPCCGNSVHFPDCNHGMAMLGLLELMASQGISEQEMWKTALAVNSYWFPDTYLTIATYMKDKGVEWKDVNPQEMLGANYSSAQGYARIAAQVTAPAASSGGESGCAVGGSAPVRSPAKQGGGGCGI
ncbi:MAG: hypothetical protein UY50_C0011G0022 [Parcubacteria group bacterium GW2011_GWA2_49_9]|nr:MAG: hypothetical protein UY50_C0011G0022 [Parcubacteria group bacterium GW2011_GWA2_49_9]